MSSTGQLPCSLSGLMFFPTSSSCLLTLPPTDTPPWCISCSVSARNASPRPGSLLSCSLFFSSLCLPLWHFSLASLLFSHSSSGIPFLSCHLMSSPSCFCVSWWGLPNFCLGGRVTVPGCPRQVCAPHTTCLWPWMMQPVFLEGGEGSSSGKPFA